MTTGDMATHKSDVSLNRRPPRGFQEITGNDQPAQAQIARGGHIHLLCMHTTCQ